ncbi:BsaWI family type II restriction enzyme [Aquimonas voraii]|uniref:Transcriptional regulator, contains XRE-family HTH domain n=1 Tax=Aquimonas voraii TaxID=265719 RepID=A0A1G7AF28_9GAMM|nr:BsaWI family type II restriction enzyme [Aquimonas voraii]SDE13409.1 Transcriptional regulator, contains XRE-family HTH domain [Aquimonas voraii]
MKTTSERKYVSLVEWLVDQRKAKGFKQKDLSDRLDLSQSNISRYEKRELQLDIELLARWCEILGQTMEDALRFSGYLEAQTPEARKTLHSAHRSNETALPIGASETNNGFNLLLSWRNKEYPIHFPGSDIGKFLKVEREIAARFASLNSARKTQSNRDAIAEALLLAISEMPEANPSDIYHHVVYRLYLREYNRTDPKQSWVRAGGEAVELFFKHHYSARLATAGISIELAFEAREKNKFLTEMGLADQVAGGSKLDICLYGMGRNGPTPFAGVHAKASLAERVSDDKPCSERMMAAGFKSYLFTFDAKSFPPPTGDLQNLGELGTPSKPSDKRSYIEKHGSFDACFSYNTRTVPSGPATESGKKVYTSRFDDSDALLTTVIDDWRTWRKSRSL